MAAEVYTVREVAERLKMSEHAVYNAIRRGDIPSLKVGRVVRVPIKKLEEMLRTAE